MYRRIFLICVVLGLLALSSLLVVPLKALALTATKTATPSPIPFPQANFVATPLSGTAPLTVQFTHLYTSTTSPILNCRWTFGDGTSESVTGSFTTCPATSHVYTTTGNFTVQMSVQITDMVFLVTKTNYIQVTPVGGWTPTRTRTPGCGAVVVVTSTPSPVFTPTAPTPTRTATACGGIIFITATPDGPTATPTRTHTPGTPTHTPTRTSTPFPGTPTVTPSRTPTQSTGFICSPVTGTIAAPFAQDGMGNFCWQTSNLGSAINSWNLASLTVNGVNYTNTWASTSSLPARIGTFWYVGYSSTSAWGHFEAQP